jgi:hypothetical protein
MMEPDTEIKGIQYVVDGAGKTTAVIISLEVPIVNFKLPELHFSRLSTR